MSKETTSATRMPADFERELRDFSGSLTRYRSPFGLLYTEGVRHLIVGSAGVLGPTGKRCGGAFWLIDQIALAQPRVRGACNGFQLWELTVENTGAALTCRPDSDQEPIHTEHIDYTDFPLGRVKLYVIDHVALLPGEY
jgi:hypothetical protein